MKKKLTETEKMRKLLNRLDEGTWAIPNTKERMTELITNLDYGVTAEEAETAINHLVGDDDLFDSIDEIKEDNPDSLIMDVVINKVNKWIKDYETNPESFRDKWQEDAIIMWKRWLNGKRFKDFYK